MDHDDQPANESDLHARQYAVIKEYLTRFAEQYHIVGRLIPSPDIYHYTSVDGVRGIVEGESIWFTSTAFLNDVTEMIMAVGMISKTIEDRRQKATGSRRNFYDALHDHKSKWEGNEAYVFSLSEHGDQLSQWRAYGSDGQGFSVGFDFSTLSVALQTSLQKLKTSPDLWFYRVLYDPAEQTDLIAWVVDMAASMYAGHTGDDAMLQYMLAMVDRQLNGLAPFLKHSSFREEREARCVIQYQQTLPEYLSYRQARGLLVPYMDVGIGDVDPEAARLIPPDGSNALRKRPVTEVVIGPRDHKVDLDTERSLYHFMRTLGRETEIAVRQSRVPYRSTR